MGRCGPHRKSNELAILKYVWLRSGASKFSGLSGGSRRELWPTNDVVSGGNAEWNPGLQQRRCNDPSNVAGDPDCSCAWRRNTERERRFPDGFGTQWWHYYGGFNVDA